jgi:hypothetical protein
MRSSMTRIASIALLIALFSTTAIRAHAQASSPASILPPNNFHFDGSWNCEGAFGNGKAHKSKFTGATILGAKWIELTEQDIEPATGYLAKYLLGFDPAQKRFVEFDANNFGAATYSNADGWQNSAMTMTSPISDDPKAPYVANRFVYTIANKDAFNVDWQISKTATLSWITSDHLACKRTSPA